MTRGEALLSYLNSAQRGAWSTFREAASRFTELKDKAYLVARALVSRGLLEVDWDADLAWCTPPTAIVQLPNFDRGEPAFIAIGILERDHLETFANAGVALESRSFSIIRDLSYTQWILKGDVTSAMESSALENDPRLHFDFYDHTRAAADRLMNAIPTVFQILQYARTAEPTEIAHADVIEVYDAGRRGFSSVEQVDLSRDYDCLRTQWRFGRRRYYRVSGGICRRIEREVGICAALQRAGKRIVEVARDSLLAESGVALPMLLERCLFFAGAEVLPEGRYRRYAPLPNALARQASYRLGIAPKTEV